jgi:hypothetical protein
MDGTGADQNKTDLEALLALQADAQELERIEGFLNRFNVFEAIGFVTQELMHSNFLAFLLESRPFASPATPIQRTESSGKGFLKAVAHTRSQYLMKREKRNPLAPKTLHLPIREMRK